MGLNMNIQSQSHIALSFHHFNKVVGDILTSVIFLALLVLGAVVAINLTSHVVLAVYDVNAFMRAAIPSMGLFQLANVLFWSVVFFSFI